MQLLGTELLHVGIHAGECQGLEQQLQQVTASEGALKTQKLALEQKVSQLEELLATTQAARDGLTGERVKE